MGEQGRKHSREAVLELAPRLNFDAKPFVELMDVRAGTADRKQLNAADVAARYLSAIEKVAEAVDEMRSSLESTKQLEAGEGLAVRPETQAE
jgi:hypothetical protein